MACLWPNYFPVCLKSASAMAAATESSSELSATGADAGLAAFLDSGSGIKYAYFSESFELRFVSRMSTNKNVNVMPTPVTRRIMLLKNIVPFLKGCRLFPRFIEL